MAHHKENSPSYLAHFVGMFFQQVRISRDWKKPERRLKWFFLLLRLLKTFNAVKGGSENKGVKAKTNSWTIFALGQRRRDGTKVSYNSEWFQSGANKNLTFHILKVFCWKPIYTKWLYYQPRIIIKGEPTRMRIVLDRIFHFANVKASHALHLKLR